MKVVFKSCIVFSLLSITNSFESTLRKGHRQLNNGIITQLVLVNADTDVERIDLIPDTVNTINLQDLKLPVSTKFSVEAIANEGLNEVVFDNGKYEGKAPYARCGNSGSDFKPCNDLQLGANVLVTATSLDSAGNGISTVSATVQIIDGTAAPTKSPTTGVPTTIAPTKSPTIGTPTTAAPTKSPTTAAPASTPVGCGIPKFVGSWENFENYPLKIAEAQGAMIGNDFFLVGGFQDGFDVVTAKSFALDIKNPNAGWRQMDDIPISKGITHAASVVIGRKFYMCGGYVGGHPGTQTDICMVYDHDASPGSQWSTNEIPPLPKSRGAGAMVHSSVYNTLTYSAGAQRPNVGKALTVDYTDTWVLDLDEIENGWVQKDDIPFEANHVGFVTAHDDQGRERQFIFGGHVKYNMKDGYVNDNYEWEVGSEKWKKRANMTIPSGHTASSTRPIGCGFLIAGGSTNGEKVRAVYYYDIPSDSWTYIGDLSIDINTPICDFGVDGYLYCTTGPPGRYFSERRMMVIDYN